MLLQSLTIVLENLAGEEEEECKTTSYFDG
jgi:hypothetical protein